MTRTQNKPRPKTLLDAERLARGLSFSELGEALGVRRGTAWRYCQPEGDENAQSPVDPEVKRKLRVWSGGRITSDNHAGPPPVKHRKKPAEARP